MDVNKFLKIANNIHPGAFITVMYGKPLTLAKKAKDDGLRDDDGKPFYPIQVGTKKTSDMNLTDPNGKPVEIKKYSIISGQFGVEYGNTKQVQAALEAGWDPQTRTYKDSISLNDDGTVFEYGGKATICLYKAPGVDIHGEHKYVVHDIFGDDYTVTSELTDAENIYLKKSDKDRSDYNEIKKAREKDKEQMQSDEVQKKFDIQGWMRLLVENIFGVYYGGAFITEDMSMRKIQEAMDNENKYMPKKVMMENYLLNHGKQRYVTNSLISEIKSSNKIVNINTSKDRFIEHFDRVSKRKLTESKRVRKIRHI